MIVFAATVPNSPLLLDKVNPRTGQAQQTLDALVELSHELYATHPDTIVIISEHPTQYKEAFSMNLHDPYTFDLSEFGMLHNELIRHPDMMLIDRLQRHLRKEHIPLSLTSDEHLDYATAIPLHFLTQKLPKTKIIPMTISDLPRKSHYQFGQQLKDVLAGSDKRIAVVVSGNLSHALTVHSPAGYHVAGEQFDTKIRDILRQKNTAGLLQLDESIEEQAQHTIYRQLLILFGLLERVSVRPHELSYEAPFDVGFLVMRFEVS